MRSSEHIRQRAKSLRSTLTPPELALWTRLRARTPGHPNFRRQHPIGPYVLDFYCAKARLCVEVDGQGHDLGDQPVRDLRRDAFLEGEGVRVMRYRALEVMQDPDGVAQSIHEAAAAIYRERGKDR
jgi:very-short-patch-repair endonuclease